MTTIELEEDTLENVLSVTDRSASRSIAQPKTAPKNWIGRLLIGSILATQVVWLSFLGLVLYYILS